MPLPSLPTRLGSTLSADEINAAKPATPPRAKATKQTSSAAATKTAATTPSVKQESTTPVSKTAKARTPVTASAAATTQKTPPAAKSSKRRESATRPKVAKLFVLDTNVLLHDSNSLFKFEEHDVYLPMMVLEELDHQKKGMSEVARNARQVSRNLDGLVADHSLDKGLPLNALG